jgi:hypothetical protein
VAGETKSLLLETQMLVIKLAGAVNSRTTLVLEIKMLTIMKMAGPAEAEVVEDVAALTTTKVEIVLSLRAASNAVRKVTFQENVLILAEAVGEVHQEVVVASSAARRVTWLVTVPAVMQVVATTILRVGVVVEEELQAARLMLAIASSARERVISREIALTIMVKAMLSPTRDRGAMKMVVLTAEEAATTTMLHPLATVVSGVTILHLLKTRVHSGEHQPTTTPMPTQTPGEILTTATTTRLRMIHGAPATTMMGAAAAGTEQ